MNVSQWKAAQQTVSGAPEGNRHWRAAMPWAALLAVLPLTALATPTVPNKLMQELSADIQQHGTTRVIVGLKTDSLFQPAGLLRAEEVTVQAQGIARAQEALSTRLRNHGARETARFEHIPYMGMAVNAEALDQLIHSPEIESIEPDLIVEPTLAQSVPLIGGSTAWNLGYRGEGWTVAILDTGVDKAHPFLTGKVVSEACYSTTDQVSSTSVCPGGVSSSIAAGSAAPCKLSGCDHGTHVAGIAVGRNAGTGYNGVAPGASLIAIQVFSNISGSPGAYTSDIIHGLERVWALRSTYKIASVNMSLGGGSYSSPCDTQSIKAAIDNLRSSGIATIIASGNNGYTAQISFPACVSTAVSVGATCDAANAYGTCPVDGVTSYSNASKYLSLLAPGSAITSSVPGKLYATKSGTSMATPHIAGAWILLKQKNKNLDVATGLQTLKTTGKLVTDSRNGLSFSRINIGYALTATAAPFADVPDNNVFARYVNTIYGLGITTGCSSGNYCPDQNVNRAQMAAFLVRAAEGEPAANCTVAPFADVPATDAMCKYIKRAKELAIIGSCGNNNYCPTQNITRAQMAAFLIRAVEGEPTTGCTTAPFTDVPATDALCKYIQRVKTLGISTGCSAGNYCPTQAVTRGQMAAFIARGFLDMD